MPNYKIKKIYVVYDCFGEVESFYSLKEAKLLLEDLLLDNEMYEGIEDKQLYIDTIEAKQTNPIIFKDGFTEKEVSTC